MELVEVSKDRLLSFPPYKFGLAENVGFLSLRLLLPTSFGILYLWFPFLTLPGLLRWGKRLPLFSMGSLLLQAWTLACGHRNFVSFQNAFNKGNKLFVLVNQRDGIV